MKRLGVMRFQSNDKMDVFHVAEVWRDGAEPTDGYFMNIGEGSVGGDPPWVNAKPPQMKTVDINGDTVYIQAWLNVEPNSIPYSVTIYIEYEVREEFSHNEEQRDEAKSNGDQKNGEKEESAERRSEEKPVTQEDTSEQIVEIYI